MSDVMTLKFQAISEADRMLIRSTEAIATTILICKLLFTHLADCPPPRWHEKRQEKWHEIFADGILDW